MPTEIAEILNPVCARTTRYLPKKTFILYVARVHYSYLRAPWQHTAHASGAPHISSSSPSRTRRSPPPRRTRHPSLLYQPGTPSRAARRG